jgi:hypothetical protein
MCGVVDSDPAHFGAGLWIVGRHQPEREPVAVHEPRPAVDDDQAERLEPGDGAAHRVVVPVLPIGLEPGQPLELGQRWPAAAMFVGVER